MRQQRDEVAMVARIILNALTFGAALTRDQLIDRVFSHTSDTGNPAWRWKRITAARRVRDALVLLLDGPNPVISAGHGYKLAARASAEERERAAQLAERAGARLLAKARKIRAARLPVDPVQCDLGFEARR